MDCFGPLLMSPRIIRSDRPVHGRIGSASPMARFADRRSSISSALPRSRSSYGCTISDVGRDGSLVTRHITTDRLHRMPLDGISPYSSLQCRRASVGQSFSSRPTTLNWTRSDRWSQSALAQDQTSPGHRGCTPRSSRRDSLSQPYYTVGVGGSGDEGVVLKRTSVCGSQSPLRTQPPRRFSTSSHLPPGSSAVSKRYSVDRSALDDVAKSGERLSVHRSTTPSTDRGLYFSKRSSVNQPLLQSGDVSPPSKYTSRYLSRVFPAAHRGSISSLFPTPVRKISVLSKPKTENGPKSSIEVVELEDVPTSTKAINKETLDTDDKFHHHQELLVDLKKKTAEAKNRLSKHRMLLDRHLPVKLGPEPEVAFEIQNKYVELVERLPFIEKKVLPKETEKESESTAEWSTKIRPYSPAAPVKSYTSTLYGIHVPSSFTPTISETRKRARDVLCRVKGDPNYFNYSV